MTRRTPDGALTEAQQRCLDLLCEGLSNRQIAERMYVEESTVKNRLHEVYRALGVINARAAIVVTLREGDE